jgi:hypothetical protein
MLEMYDAGITMARFAQARWLTWIGMEGAGERSMPGGRPYSLRPVPG